MKRKLFVSGAKCFALRVPGRIYSDELGDGRSDIDVVNVFQVSSREVRAGGIKYRLHLGQPRLVTVLSEKTAVLLLPLRLAWALTAFMIRTAVVSSLSGFCRGP